MDRNSICRHVIVAPTLLAVFLWNATGVPAQAQACGSPLSTGQPACPVQTDVGSNAPQNSQHIHVGNPIDVVSGNKYQGELDIRLGGSRLSLVRHYNSRLSASNHGLGNGWRHSYDVLLMSAGESGRRIVQSDGRIIDFQRIDNLFQAAREHDGYVLEQPDGTHGWHLPDGRIFEFSGSFLIGIYFPGDGQLSLYYKNARVHSVTDELGRSLVFQYAEGRLGLPAYDDRDIDAPPGHLMAVSLPDGTSVRYSYSSRHNLKAVRYPGDIKLQRSLSYRYQDERNSSLLIERAMQNGRLLGRWEYDLHDRAISYRSGFFVQPDDGERGPDDVSLSYSTDSSTDSGVTSVRFRNGSHNEYKWQADRYRQVISIQSEYFDADGARVSPGDVNPDDTDASQDEYSPPLTKLSLSTLGRKTHDAAPASQDAAEALATNSSPEVVLPQTAPATDDPYADFSQSEGRLTILEVNALGHPSRISFYLAITGDTHLLDAHYDQAGRLNSVKWQRGVLHAFNTDRETSAEELSKYAEQNLPDRIDVMRILSSVAEKSLLSDEARRYLQAMQAYPDIGESITRDEVDQAWDEGNIGNIWSESTGIGFDKRSIPTETQCINPLTNCESLLSMRDYAEVAECAYTDLPCNTRFREADLGLLGLSQADLHAGSFHAEIFYDSQNDIYIVTFAGTDMYSPADWYNNIAQEGGIATYQYQKAVRLASQLNELRPDLNFNFTGHSLGGGLAAAAAAVGSDLAITFNPAALTYQTSVSLGINYDTVSQNTTSYSVEGELLGSIQNGLDFVNNPPGVIYQLKNPSLSWISSELNTENASTYGISRAVKLHGIAAALQSISESIERMQCIS